MCVLFRSQQKRSKTIEPLCWSWRLKTLTRRLVHTSCEFWKGPRFWSLKKRLCEQSGRKHTNCVLTLHHIVFFFFRTRLGSLIRSWSSLKKQMMESGSWSTGQRYTNTHRVVTRMEIMFLSWWGSCLWFVGRWWRTIWTPPGRSSPFLCRRSAPVTWNDHWRFHQLDTTTTNSNLARHQSHDTHPPASLCRWIALTTTATDLTIW